MNLMFLWKHIVTFVSISHSLCFIYHRYNTDWILLYLFLLN
ncbi:hypothetical protein HORM4_610026 [Vibrio harveyi]|nr:hypothetical protein HORM4_610026 [Vibrio harveyi]